MSYAIEAVFEEGVFKPLQPVQLTEGQRAVLSVGLHHPSAGDAASELDAWQQVCAGLLPEDLAVVEQIALECRDLLSGRNVD
jgi:predicted DNA-binding antitoxin AbrB/MazE fold protein